ncbi:MAG: hypothetical protein QNJ91_03160 [Gammaproteobacteria bacterium]|nr:hypothetical protein [Gammaproteobacteria bacterium]
MRASVERLLDRFAALSLREQLLILLALFAVAYQTAELVVFDRQYQRVDALNRAIARDHGAISGLNTELAVLSVQARQDPNRELRHQIAAVRTQVAGLQQRLRDATGRMISPQDMAQFLERLLEQEDDLTMLSLRTLDATPLLPLERDDVAAPRHADALHRHAFEIAFSGSYLATLRYLEALEALPWQFFWESVSFDVIAYPHSEVRLRLHTLSLSEDWIGV